MLELDIKHPSIEWAVCRESAFHVLIRAWTQGGRWNWNVYAYIFDNHPMHQKPEWASNYLPFHWGATLENRIVTTPAHGIKYEWQRVSDVLKLGSDYSHHGDDHESDDPKDGIPGDILWDAQKLAECLLEVANNAEVTA